MCEYKSTKLSSNWSLFWFRWDEDDRRVMITWLSFTRKPKLNSTTTHLTILIDIYRSCKFRLIGCSEYASWCWNIAKKAISRINLHCCMGLEKSARQLQKGSSQYSRYMKILDYQSWPAPFWGFIWSQYKFLRKSSKACWSRLSSHLGVVYSFLYLSVPSSCAILGVYVCHRSLRLNGRVLFPNFPV